MKNAFIYTVRNDISSSAQSIEAALQAQAFAACGPTQEMSVGWIPPRGQANGAMLETVGGHWILKLMTESKRVPTDVINRKVAEKVEEIEASTGRKPGKKEKRELKEDAKLALLPMAFTSRSTTTVWIDPAKKTLVIDTASQAKADAVVTALIKCIDGLALQLINTNTSPAAAMAHWLSTMEAPSSFTVDRECELKAADESKSVVRYGRHALDIDEVAQHVRQGKIPTKLAMTWNDRVSFVLSDGFQIKKIDFLDTVFLDGDSKSAHDAKDDAFDADMAIMTGEMSKLIPDLIDALGGVNALA